MKTPTTAIEALIKSMEEYERLLKFDDFYDGDSPNTPLDIIRRHGATHHLFDYAETDRNDAFQHVRVCFTRLREQAGIWGLVEQHSEVIWELLGHYERHRELVESFQQHAKDMRAVLFPAVREVSNFAGPSLTIVPRPSQR